MSKNKKAVCTHTPEQQEAERQKTGKPHWCASLEAAQKQYRARKKALAKKEKIRTKITNQVMEFWRFFIYTNSAVVQTAGFKIDKKGRPFFSIKFKTEGQDKRHVVKTACVWKDTKGNYRILMNVGRTYLFRLRNEDNTIQYVERNKHFSVSFLMKNQKTIPVLINQGMMISFLPVELDKMMENIFDRANGLEVDEAQDYDGSEPF